MLLLTLAAFMTACATAPKTFPEIQSQAAPPDRATLFVYRHYAEPAESTVEVRVDGRRSALLDQRSFTRLDVLPGKRMVRTTWPSLTRQVESEIELNLAVGSVTYLEIVGVYEPRFANAALTGSTARVRVGAGLNEIAPNEASKTLSACCRYSAPY